MLKDMSVMHPAAKMLVDLSAAQDVEAGDGTTSVVVIAGSLLGAADRLLAKGESTRSLRVQSLTLLKASILPSFPSLSNEQQLRQWRR
jgi:chaperonin GroEL (HSP60 family)